MIRVISSIVFIGMLCVQSAYAEMTKDQAQLAFIKAGAAYQTEDYADAINQYQKILKAGWASSAVYYNLGNAYFKKEQLGKAVLHYQRALRLSPRDPDIRANMRFAKASVEYYGNQESQGSVLSWLPYFKKITLDEMAWILIGLFILLGCVLFIGIVRQWRLSRMFLWGGVICITFIFHIGALVVKVNYLKGQSVILTETKAKFEPMANATDHFQLGEGMIVKMLKKQYGWIKVLRDDGRIGWVPERTVEKI